MATAFTNLSQYSNNQISYIIDNNSSTFFWSNGGPSTNRYVGVDLGEVTTLVGKIEVYTGDASSPNDYMQNGTLEYSVDNINYYALGTYYSQEAIYNLGQGTLNARYLRFRSNINQSNWLKVREFKWYTLDEIRVVEQGNLYRWSSSFSNPVVPVSYQIGDYIVVMVMASGNINPPSGWTMVTGDDNGSGLIIFYRRMTNNGTNFVVSGLSGNGDVRYILVRGAKGVISSASVDGSARTIVAPDGSDFVVVTTGNSSTREFRWLCYDRVPSTNWSDTDYYTMAWRTITNNQFSIPNHSLWNGNDVYIIFSNTKNEQTTHSFYNTSNGRYGSYQTFVVPYGGIYTIEARGAQGGWSENSRGSGAIIRGKFVLKRDDVLKILVGQSGQPLSGDSDGGGGGGTFVAKVVPDGTSSDRMWTGEYVVPLIIAGGGGGAGSDSNGAHGSTDEYARGYYVNSNLGYGWTSGSGPGGGGFRGGGSNGAQGFLQGGSGGQGNHSWGGFGGGAGGDNEWGAGGGGYTGGRGYDGPSAGGGSYNAGTEKYATTGNYNQGMVMISREQTVYVEDVTATTPFHNENVTLKATLNSYTEDDQMRYKIFINDVQVRPQTGYLDVYTYPLTIEETFDASLFKVGSNTIGILLEGEGSDVLDETIIIRTNTSPSVVQVSNNSPVHKEQARLQFKVIDPEGDYTQYRIVLNDTEEISSWSILGDYTTPRDLIISNKRLKIGDNKISIFLKDSLGATTTTDFTVKKINEKPTVDINYLEGYILRFTVNDIEGDDVAFRVLIDGQEQMGFADYFPVPYQVEVSLDPDLVTRDTNNYVTVEVKDDGSATNSAMLGKIFGHKGLVFCDVNETLYSDDVGYILKVLDHDVVVAGNPSPWIEVWVKNNMGYDMKYVKLTVNQGALDPVHEKVELAFPTKDDTPAQEIALGRINSGQKKSFFIRVNADRQALTGGRFFVYCTGDPV
jgi:Glycine rich protein/F5/8 type C domain